jgi:hypothetical protein
LNGLKEAPGLDFSQISEEETRLLEKKVTEENPLHLVTGGALSIKTKDGRLVKLHLNSTQLKLIAKIIELRKQKKPIRLWLLKYRQGGVSTEIEAILYALTSQQPNRNSLIIADEKEHADNLFEMTKLYQDKLEQEYPYLAPTLKKSNEKKLEFEALHSQIIIASAENTEAAKSHTFQYVHISETAFFRSLKLLMDDLNQTVPDHWDTMIIGETTANGMEDFYKEWMRAIRGETAWTPLFFAWFEMEEYSMPLQNGELYPLKGINFDADTTERIFLEEEEELKIRHNLTQEQLNWRRHAIVNRCQGDMITFKTQYPATWEEAFSLSGDIFFDKRGIQKQIAKRPSAIGELFYQNLKWEWRDMPLGRIKIYEKPSEGEQYLVVSDASEGLGSDEAAIVVLNKRTNTTAAIVNDKNITPEELAELDIALGNYYNTALVVPENKGYGYMVCQLVHQKYGNVYRRIVNKDGVDSPADELGFNTNSVTRPQMLAQLNEELKNNSTSLYAKEIIDECSTFVIKKDKKTGKVIKVEAQTGCQDGLVIVRSIAGIVRQQFPYVISKTAPHKAKQAALINEFKKPVCGYKR